MKCLQSCWSVFVDHFVCRSQKIRNFSALLTKLLLFANMAAASHCFLIAGTLTMTPVRTFSMSWARKKIFSQHSIAGWPGKCIGENKLTVACRQNVVHGAFERSYEASFDTVWNWAELVYYYLIGWTNIFIVCAFGPKFKHESGSPEDVVTIT